MPPIKSKLNLSEVSALLNIINLFLPSLITTSVFGVLVFLSRELLITRLKNAVKHEYDVKLESLKALNKDTEQRLQAEISKRDKEIAAIHDVTFSGLAHRKSILFERQLAAVDELWQAYVALSPAKLVSSMVSRFNINEVSKSIGHNINLREMFKTISQNVDMKKLGEIKSTSLRPFVSEQIWAYFSAYQSIVIHYVLLAKLFELGLEDNITNSNSLIELLIKVLPHQKEFIEKYKIEGSFHLLDEIEQKLLDSIKTFLSGKEMSKEQLQEASEIIKYSEQLRSTEQLQ